MALNMAIFGDFDDELEEYESILKSWEKSNEKLEQAKKIQSENEQRILNYSINFEKKYGFRIENLYYREDRGEKNTQ